ncbi:hypothetical protein H2O60_05085 [Leuconostoc mesenteroides]|uniref:hypothetical protein n=1 Tax=Leuconostoc mesenteroides TaxID=1245 RepID=UPI0015F71EAB|nr:hypothetical protein [Leuconostoc mesenteroides]MBA5972523.1 hypothetical protein [Leuconostoc mesenteroides]
MNEKPVAYGVVADGRLVEIRYLRKYNPNKDYDLTPLYTRNQLQPTVEMTKKQYNTFKWHKDNLDFSACLVTFQNYNGETRMGIKFDNLKGDLSDEDIMQAWLHPETIKIVDE